MNAKTGRTGIMAIPQCVIAGNQNAAPVAEMQKAALRGGPS
jgi:hypothetical protein